MRTLRSARHCFESKWEGGAYIKMPSSFLREGKKVLLSSFALTFLIKWYLLQFKISCGQRRQRPIIPQSS